MTRLAGCNKNYFLFTNFMKLPTFSLVVSLVRDQSENEPLKPNMLPNNDHENLLD